MLPGLTVEQLALATASAMRVLKDALIASGVDPLAIDDQAERKAQDLVAGQGQDNAGNMLRIFLVQLPD